MLTYTYNYSHSHTYIHSKTYSHAATSPKSAASPDAAALAMFDREFQALRICACAGGKITEVLHILALIYLVLAIYLGDFLCRRFYRFTSVAHRLGAAVITGLLISSWVTYLAGLLFTPAKQPLFWSNLLLFVVAIALLCSSIWKSRFRKPTQTNRGIFSATNLYLTRSKGSSIADWVLIAGYVVLVSWMMFASFSAKGGKLHISNPEYSDFGPNTAIMQSFGVGHNFPTEYPHFSGDRIRYHFLFYFQAGNLEFLGLDPAWSLNLLSIITLVAMLILVTALGEALFDSRAVGRVGSVLFFFFGSLSYVPFLHTQRSGD